VPERIFEPRSVVLVANTAQTITWSVNDFAKYWSGGDGVIYGNVSVRFRVQNATPNVVFLALNYNTRYGNIPFNERKNIASVTANTTVELSKATVPTIGALKDAIQLIQLTLIGAQAGTVTVTLIISDTDELSASASPLDNSASASADLGYLTINQVANQVCNAGTNNTLIAYTVPAGKRFILDLLTGYLEPTPSFPELLQWSAYLPSPSISIYYTSLDTEGNSFTALQNSGYIFTGGDTIQVDVFNSDTTAHLARAFMIGREVF